MMRLDSSYMICIVSPQPKRRKVNEKAVHIQKVVAKITMQYVIIIPMQMSKDIHLFGGIQNRENSCYIMTICHGLSVLIWLTSHVYDIHEEKCDTSAVLYITSQGRAGRKLANNLKSYVKCYRFTSWQLIRSRKMMRKEERLGFKNTLNGMSQKHC